MTDDSEVDERPLTDKAESPIRTSQLFEENRRPFKFEEINSEEYMREVTRLLAANMDVKSKLSRQNYASFERTFENKGGVTSKWSKPLYDAICLILGHCRDGFDHKLFFSKFPSSMQQIAYIRETCTVFPCEVNFK